MELKYLQATDTSQIVPVLMLHDAIEMSSLGYAAHIRMQQQPWETSIAERLRPTLARALLGTKKHEELRNLRTMSNLAGNVVDYSVSFGEASAVIAIDSIHNLAHSQEAQALAHKRLGAVVATSAIEAARTMSSYIDDIEAPLH